MLFPDYKETKAVYHITSVNDLGKILKEGIKYDDKDTYLSKYLGFHKFIDSIKPLEIPDFVVREKAIFASLNFEETHKWHSHSVLLEIKINPEKCWIANENLANRIYEPFILKDIDRFNYADKYIKTEGEKMIEKYWKTSLSFTKNLELRNDCKKGYDAEVMIFHPIHPQEIKILAIVSDHRMMLIDDWEKVHHN